MDSKFCIFDVVYDSEDIVEIALTSQSYIVSAILSTNWASLFNKWLLANKMARMCSKRGCNHNNNTSSETLFAVISRRSVDGFLSTTTADYCARTLESLLQLLKFLGVLLLFIHYRFCSDDGWLTPSKMTWCSISWLPWLAGHQLKSSESSLKVLVNSEIHFQTIFDKIFLYFPVILFIRFFRTLYFLINNLWKFKIHG